jgi:hypothetical protein
LGRRPLASADLTASSGAWTEVSGSHHWLLPPTERKEPLVRFTSEMATNPGWSDLGIQVNENGSVSHRMADAQPDSLRVVPVHR